MKWILNLNQKYKRDYIISNVLLIFFDSIAFILPILIGYVVDKIVLHQDYHTFLWIMLGIAFFVLFKFAGSYFSVIKLDDTCNKIISELKQKCYKHLNQLDYAFFEQVTHGELLTNFTSDMNHINQHISYNIKTIGAIVISFTCSFIYLLSIHVPFTFILLTPGIIIGILSNRFLKKMKPNYKEVRDLTSKSNDFISDNIEANRVVRTFALEKTEIKKMKKITKKYIDKDIENCLLEDDFYYGEVPFFSYFMNVIFLLVGGYLFIQGSITIGELIIFNAYLYNLRAPFIRLSGLLSSVERYHISKDKIEKLLNAKPTTLLCGTKPISSLKVPIEFLNVKIVYDKRVILENLNLKINPNETIAFIGKTGSGKSSIANLLLGFITPESGRILLDGKNYLNYDIHDIRAKIGYVTQEAFLFSDTIYNNICYGDKSVSKEKADYLAKTACCDYIDRLPDGIDTVIGEKGVGLSGGEKQRLSLARALAVQPDILLLDDITSALDIETEEKINESIHQMDSKTTKIIIASKVVSVMNANQIYVLDKGSVIESGTHQELLEKKGYYYKLYNIQKGEF